MHSSPCAFVGFDSAWTDNPRAPGAVCALVTRADGPPAFHAPQLATFAHALAFIRAIQKTSRLTLIALDQPTIVTNTESLRPVERVAASLVSWLGGGVQPSNRGRMGMFCDAAPIWSFLNSLGAIEDPEAARIASDGLYLMEVFPAISMPSLSAEFFGRLAAPRYNPARRKTFKASDWTKVTIALAEKFAEFKFPEPAQWLRMTTHLPRVSKADQDCLDAMVCLWIALHWRLKDRRESLVIGGKDTGYMVLPAIEGARLRLTAAAKRAVSGVRAYGTDLVD
ncbi:DUF429 domain-containing protein [Paracoccus litorisediminis]|uniref:DUF429 domain-containing protein n=2 Tax=Paracoccus litorisediminis TaxID=2006130 RepID=A0A844HTA3_9RHOB|nr:DUF429 domain-containing protein [Paracoccus litorisediminis]